MSDFLVIMVIAALTGVGIRHLVDVRTRPPVPRATMVLALVTAAVSTAGNLAPGVLAALGRDRDLLMAGQWWRIITPLLVQDGGWAGMAFNLAVLLIAGTFAETLHGPRTTVTGYLLAGVVSEVAAYTVLQHQGFAGNSVANLGLCGMYLVTMARDSHGVTRALSAVGLMAGAGLLATGDLHGVGFATGVAAGVVAVALRPRGRRGVRAARPGPSSDHPGTRTEGSGPEPQDPRHAPEDPGHTTSGT